MADQCSTGMDVENHAVLHELPHCGAYSACDHSARRCLRSSHRERGAAARPWLCAHDDADVASEDGHKPDQSLRREPVEAAVPDGGNLRLTHPEDTRRINLRQTFRFEHADDLSREPCLGEVLLGLFDPNIGEYVAAPLDPANPSMLGRHSLALASFVRGMHPRGLLKTRANQLRVARRRRDSALGLLLKDAKHVHGLSI